ncbi:MAG: TRAP transporter substrate-binding protein [Burkholderiaceae bacterium]|nr:TRAP transporter substrate-binding protein [Burkholderiaceae bacterium]
MPAGAQQFTFNLADGYAPTEFINVNMQAWAEDIRKATNGAVQIRMHFSGSLFKNPDIKRAVQTGQVEFGTQLMQNLGPEKRLFEIDGIPFLAVGYADGMKLWEISRPYLTAHLQKQGLRLLYTTPWPSQGFFFKKEVNSLADIKGLRQRAYNQMTSRLAELMGTVPTTIQHTELPQAMTTGTVQAFNTSPTSGVVLKAWEYSTHYYDTSAWMPKQMVFMNEAVFGKLPQAFQQAILEASAIAEKRGWELSRQKAEEARQTFAAQKGFQVLKPSATFQHELDKIGETLRDEWLQSADADAKKVMEQYLKVKGH